MAAYYREVIQQNEFGRPARALNCAWPMGKCFGAELRRLRMAVGLSLYDFTIRIHVSRGHLSKVENNMTTQAPRCATLLRLARPVRRYAGDRHRGRGKVDQACEFTRGILPDARDLGFATIRHALRQLARAFCRYPAYPQVRVIQPDLGEFLRAPGPPKG